MGSDEMKTVTATTTAVPKEDDVLIADESATRKPNRDIAAAVWTITCGVALPCIPVVVISAVLLYFIFHYRIVPHPGWPELELSINHTHPHLNATEQLHDWRHHGGIPAYYVQYNPSTITTIASWTGRVIPYLSSSIMALVAFFAARRIVTKSKKGDGSDLPTPEQLTILIGLLGGSSFEPLKDTLVHRWSGKKKLVDPIPLAFFALLVVTILGLLIPIVDTWFGIATTPGTITQLYNGSSEHHTYGRSLSVTRCPKGPGGFSLWGGLEWVSCNLGYDDGDQTVSAWLLGPDEATRVAQGVSALNVISNYTSSNGTMYYYLADKRVDSKLDFKADTFAISTQCTPVTQRCLPGVTWPMNENINFSCSPGFYANFTFPGLAQGIDADEEDGGDDQSGETPMVGLAFSPDAELSSRVGQYDPNLDDIIYQSYTSGNRSSPRPAVGSNLSYEYLLPQNPLHFVTWAWGYPQYSPDTNASHVESALLDDRQVYRAAGRSMWMLQCSAEVVDVTYTWVNGSVYQFEASPASPEMGGLISAPFGFQLGQAAASLNSLASAVSIQNTSAALADFFAEGWSHAALAMSVGVMSPTANTIEQYRNSTIAVARVPMIPLYLLLGLKALYVIAVILLAIGAYCFTHPAETEIVKTQLSTKGLAAAHFDSPGILQEKVVKEISERLQPTQQGTNQDLSGEEHLKRAATAPAELGQITDKKIGVVAHADGAWRFAVVANGVWNGIKPVAVSLVGLEAKDGNLGAPGRVINAWM